MKPYYILSGLLTLVLASLFLSGERAFTLTEEGALIEVSTAILYVIAIVFLLFKTELHWLNSRILGGIVLLAFLLRELDFDKAFTVMGIFKSRFYFSESVPMMEKISGGVVTVLLMCVVYFFVKYNYKNWVKGLREKNRTSFGVGYALALMIVSKIVLDGLPRKLGKMGLDGEIWILHFHSVVEEVLELGIPIALILSIRYAKPSSNRIEGNS